MLLLADIGLLFDIVGVILVAKFHIPSEILFPDGRDTLEVHLNDDEEGKRISRYKLFRRITIFSYFIIGIGFLLQVSFINNFLNSLL
ncbi:hypothetical protein D210916BOD24_35320 [Alteromonas sp. D210916BOD_24]|uniref:hypothetical protein n=1 Tax=Alteromonas sp. D210916BOD_24 TaxID=3157618 RepID=UPI00399C5B94